MENKLYIVNVEAAIYKGNRWLIIRRSDKEDHAPGLLSLVGGKVEADSFTPNILEETLKKEIAEEVGITVSSTMYYLESKLFYVNPELPVVDMVFMCEYLAGELKPDNNEVSEAYWMTYPEILSCTDSPEWLIESIKKAEKARIETAKI
ncbi:MAG: NUDIX hydrolase [Clostridia bacterium]|jgi:8-oxo-dGTP diphosphatase